MRVNDLNLGYGRVPVVLDFSAELRAGEVLAILGANGAGKTTALLGLMGEIRPTSGQICWFNHEGWAPLHVRARQGVGFVSEERMVIPSLSSLDNLKLGRGDVDYALHLFPELAGLMSRRAGLLSGGEQQMLTLARALSKHPRVLVADELSLGLAPLIVSRLLEVICQAQREGLATILVEQQVKSALSAADKVIVMRRGRIIMQGTSDEIARKAAELEAAYLPGPT
jgi:branched-chain amino acid transport system ATP-binding protein